MRTSDFDYELPQELIAQAPPAHRTDSRMLVLDAKTGNCEILKFPEIVRFLNPGDTLVVNDTRVIRARLFARKDTGAHLEIMLLRPAAEPMEWQCYIKPGKRAVPGVPLELLKGEEPSGYTVTVTDKSEDAVYTVKFSGNPDQIIAECGNVPLPPYIRRSALPPDAERYQTVYAVHPGAVAAPTAGLHFTPELLRTIQDNGCNLTKLTLHVGAGTFKPVTADEISDHKMHSEEYVFSPETAALLNDTIRRKNKITAVGTTSLRVLESCVSPERVFTPHTGSTDIFIYPPKKVLSADNLLTNFHLPKSTLLMLVSAFAGIENIRKAYKLAIQERMRFFSYGDCMLILR